MSRRRVLTSPAAAWLAAALGAWMVAGACRSIQHDVRPSTHVLPTPSVAGLVEAPVVRVGILPQTPRVSIEAPAGVKILARGKGLEQPYWRPLERATFLPGSGEEDIRLVETGETLARATVVPADDTEILSADARAYRGILEVRPGPEGSLTVVNVVNIEDYLRGVVPNELSPMAFPQIEALKAQAVAARTWVLAHLGDYSSKGYDVCATPACQVYRGQASEQPLTDAAVRQTRGIVATWRGRPIHAYYTSTCGGHTEDGDVIFDDRAPYLKGVVCAPEGSARHRIRTEAEPRRDLPGGPTVPRSLAVLESLGVVDASLADEPPRLAGVPSDDEIRVWVGRLQSALGRSQCTSPVTGSLARRASFAELSVASLCWRERAERLVTDDGSPLEADEKQALALLRSEGLLADGLDPNGALTRAEVLDLLAGLAEKAAPPEWRTGEFAGLADGRVTVLAGEDAVSFSLAPDARLFRSVDGVYAGAADMTLTVGDELTWVARDGRAVYLEARQTGPGVRPSPATRHYRWEARLSPVDVARGVARYGSVGEVRDLVPRKIGVSGRVVELEVQGTEGDLLLKGLKVRWGLGLRENLFVIDRETNEQGGVNRFVFSGKGWGHGVGLCQVGAFGMAQAGSSFERIIQHYYTGVRLTPVAELHLPGTTPPAVATAAPPPGNEVASRGEGDDRRPAL